MPWILYLSQGDDSLTQLTTFLTTQDVGLRGLCAMLRHFAGQVPWKIDEKLWAKRFALCTLSSFSFYLWRSGPPQSWTPCRNKLMKCLSLRVHLLDHLTSRLFGKGVTRSSRVLRSLMLTQANGPKKVKSSIAGAASQGGMVSLNPMQSYVKSNWWWWCMWLHTPHVGTGQRIYLDHTCAVVIVAWHVGEGVLTL